MVQSSHCDISLWLCFHLCLSQSCGSTTMCFLQLWFVLSFVFLFTAKVNSEQQWEEEVYLKRMVQGRGEMQERVNEEKAYYQKTDGPPIHSGPCGTWRDNSLHLRVTSSAERGGVLKHHSVCVHFCLLTCKQKANL